MSETNTQIQRPPASAPVKEVTDSLGRKLKVQQLGILKELDLIEAAGKTADNRSWMMIARAAACVVAIDGVPRPAPTTRDHIRAQIALLGSEGIEAVAEALTERLPDGDAADAAQSEIDTAKN
jgi:hypothetical protein